MKREAQEKKQIKEATQTTKHRALVGAYIMTILYAFHYGIPLYATSSYLKLSFISPFVSFLFALASVLTLFASLHISKYLREYHTYPFTMGLIVCEFFATLGFAISNNLFFLAFFFVTHFILTSLLYISLNTFVESFSSAHQTGMIRGIFLTMLNLGILISPFVGGVLLSNLGFKSLYIVSAFMLFPLALIVHKYMKHMPEPSYTKIEIIESFFRAIRNSDLRIALTTMFLLECFFAAMVIYSPIYLSSIGIPLTSYLSIILPLALIPFVIFPYELGILADTKIGEKELMILGLTIMSIATMVFAVTTSTNLFIWAAILVFSRIGASFVETMSFTYYFKKIGSRDIGLITLFSNMRMLAVIAVPIMGFVISPLTVAFPTLIFVLLSILLLYGAVHAFKLHDTR